MTERLTMKSVRRWCKLAVQVLIIVVRVFALIACNTVNKRITCSGTARELAPSDRQCRLPVTVLRHSLRHVKSNYTVLCSSVTLLCSFRS